MQFTTVPLLQAWFALCCVAACKHCNGEDCENAAEVTPVDMSLDVDDSDDDEQVDEMLMTEDCELFTGAMWIDEEIVDSCSTLHDNTATNTW